MGIEFFVHDIFVITPKLQVKNVLLQMTNNKGVAEDVHKSCVVRVLYLLIFQILLVFTLAVKLVKVLGAGSSWIFKALRLYLYALILLPAWFVRPSHSLFHLTGLNMVTGIFRLLVF